MNISNVPVDVAVRLNVKKEKLFRFRSKTGPSGTENISAYYKSLDPPKIKKNRVEHHLVFLVKKRIELEKEPS